jgi:hypothetical protein
MKTSRLALFSVLLTCALAPLAAQDAPAAAANEGGGGPMATSNLYVVQVPIEKIYSHPKGYIVEYRKSPLGNERVFIPIAWFDRAVTPTEPLKGELLFMGPGTVWPRMILYYKDGKFERVRLYVRRETNHASWGHVEPYSTFDNLFEGVEELKLEFK